MIYEFHRDIRAQINPDYYILYRYLFCNIRPTFVKRTVLATRLRLELMIVEYVSRPF
jgi:hypothetical protein